MKRFYFGFVFVGIVLSLLSIIAIFKSDEEYLTTKGTIVRIDEYYDNVDDTYNYTVYIDYEVNNTKYKDVEYGAYDSSMKVKDEVIVYYSPNDPTHIQAKGYEKVPYIVLPFALLITIFGIIKVIKA